MQILDVTLRDGGCVNNFNFGIDYMKYILHALEESKVDIIELGYLDAKNGSESGRTQYLDEQVIPKAILDRKVSGIEYVAMADYGKYHMHALVENNGRTVDGIRLAFHLEDMEEALSEAKLVLKKGYKLYIQPMVTMRYTDDLFLKLIHMVNEQLPDVEAMYIVDSFGEMREKDVRRFLYLLDTNLDEHIKIGFHGHNNLQLAYANAMSVIAFGGRHELIIDSSILGMGKGAGNLNTELLMDYANRAMGKSYEIQPIFYAMDQVIDIIRNDYRWGYSAEYFITSAEHCTPTYARYYKETYNLSVGQIYELVHKIEPIKKKSFDKNYAKHLYFANYGKEFNDSEAIERLKRSILDKRLLLIAPGKSLSWHTEEIETLLMEDDIFSISINNEIFASKYTFITREDMVKKLDASRRYILPDNLHTVEHTMANVLVISYYKWFWNGTEFLNSAGVAVLDLVKELGAKTVILAGYDGFSVDMNENYSKISLRRSIRPEQIKAYNELMQERLTNEWKGMEITFLAGKEIVFKELQ